MTKRRGSQAIEFALIGPLLLAFVCVICDLSQVLYVHDGLSAAVSAGARAGARVELFTHDDPLVVARQAAKTSFDISRVPGPAAFEAWYEDVTPDRRIVVEGKVPITPWFGLFPLPPTMAFRSTLKTTIQP